MKKVFVKLVWTLPQAGGRAFPPETGTFTGVVKFPWQTVEDWKKNAWSLRIKFVEEDGFEGARFGFASFLSDKAPHELLKPGLGFELYEGPRTVARGEVILSEIAVKNLARQMALA